MNKLLSPGEIADLLGVKKSTIYSWTHQDFIPHVKLGNLLRFKEKDIRAMGRSAAGVRGIRLKNKDEVVGMGTISKETAKDGGLFVLSDNGFGKITGLHIV